jgi:hypothetical protein
MTAVYSIACNKTVERNTARFQRKAFQISVPKDKTPGIWYRLLPLVSLLRHRHRRLSADSEFRQSSNKLQSFMMSNKTPFTCGRQAAIIRI